MEEVNRRRRTVLQVQVGELHLWRLNQSSSPRKCTSHLGLSLGYRSVENADPRPKSSTSTLFCERMNMPNRTFAGLGAIFSDQSRSIWGQLAYVKGSYESRGAAVVRRQPGGGQPAAGSGQSRLAVNRITVATLHYDQRYDVASVMLCTWREAANYWPNHRRPAREGGFRGENRQRKALASRHVAWLN